ncbi:gamma subclass chorismate mutase AroQ [Aidingimonas halophila]|uniref:chorismate mutase n=1 Tax=Aidingimonas halophila TaxID=574349 RepID=A0A1H2X3T5_9GAMM|nr:gamma subclass chorismate mutase AroQ [Aidingimonas halophila]GHC28057.1 hypothetical protein GCM10008094_19720 [Aidingimonas halophila]SDW87448.1 chorismate mutase [Aidingimonas halophila]
MRFTPRHVANTYCIIVIVALLLLAGCQTQSSLPPTEDQAAIDRMLHLIDERLEVAPLVARSKWNSGAAIEAPEREAQILDQVASRAADAGVDEDFARHFFQAQFEASKQVQRQLHERWEDEGREPFDNPPDLAEEVRPTLDRLTPALIDALNEMERLADVEGASGYLEARATEFTRDEVYGEPRETALQPLLDRL